MKSRLLRISLCLLVLLMVSISVALPVHAQDRPQWNAAWVMGPTMGGQPYISFEDMNRNKTTTIYDTNRTMWINIQTPPGLSNITAECIIYYPPSQNVSNWAFPRQPLGSSSGTYPVNFQFQQGDPYGKYAFRVGIWGTDIATGRRLWSENIGWMDYVQYIPPPNPNPNPNPDPTPKTDPLIYILIGVLVVIVAAALIIFLTRRQPAPVAQAPYPAGGYTPPTTPTPPPGTARGTTPYPGGGTGTGTRLTARVLLPDNSEVPLTGGPVTTLGRSNFSRALAPNQASVVSKQHCQISYEGGRYFIQDISLNGTKVNGMDIRGRGKVELTDGAQVSLADALTFTFRTMR